MRMGKPQLLVEGGKIMQNQMNVLRVFSKRVALELRKIGYKILFTEPNRNYPQFDVYIFEIKDGIEQEMAKIGEKIKAEKEDK